jgi:2,4-diketo-3-deoxy-L-fuconate hydrolase
VRIANISGRAALVDGAKALDVENASEGRFSSNPQDIFTHWPDFMNWAASQQVALRGVPYEISDFGPCVPRPPQVFAIALNYASHAGESGFSVPTDPVVFTKFPSSLTGPQTTVRLTGQRVDWEAELVAVVGNGGRNILEADAWDHVAGLTVGQDLSDRDVQFWGNPPQFSLGKSQAGFSPLGPWMVTLDEIRSNHNMDDLAIECVLTDLDGSDRILQSGRTRDMIFSIPAILSRLSAIVELLPGDIIFTGTPEGVGVGRTPPEFLRSGQVLTTTIEGIGALRQSFVGP